MPADLAGTSPPVDGPPARPEPPDRRRDAGVPGRSHVHLLPRSTLEHDGVAVTAMRMGSHTGTHVDAPSHTVAGGRTMADVPLDELVGEALLMRMPRPGTTARSTTGTGWSARDRFPRVLPPIVIIDTGWARWFGDQRRHAASALAPSAARELVRRGMRVLAVDTLSPDLTGGEGFPVHESVLGADRLIVENRARARRYSQSRVGVGFFPLRLAAMERPVRAVAFLPALTEGQDDGLRSSPT